MFRLIQIGVLTGSLALAACVHPEYQHTTTGAAVGGITGAIIGHQLDDDDGRYYGGAAGAILGGAIGNQLDNAYNRPQNSGYYYPNNYPNSYSSGNSNSYYNNGYRNNYSNQPSYYQQNSGYATYPYRY
jgi:hypothetical protein